MSLREPFWAWSRICRQIELSDMLHLLLFCVLLIFCWPLALLALVLYPIVWLLLLPFRIVGIAVHGVLALVAAVIFLPARLIRSIA
ncbi:MAG: hypothetical protein JWP08_2554 [Bryobacterales bacterium]|nr:hypothetical protein [Bryobacterales bacterium]